MKIRDNYDSNQGADIKPGDNRRVRDVFLRLDGLLMKREIERNPIYLT